MLVFVVPSKEWLLRWPTGHFLAFYIQEQPPFRAKGDDTAGKLMMDILEKRSPGQSNLAANLAKGNYNNGPLSLPSLPASLSFEDFINGYFDPTHAGTLSGR